MRQEPAHDQVAKFDGVESEADMFNRLVDTPHVWQLRAQGPVLSRTDSRVDQAMLSLKAGARTPHPAATKVGAGATGAGAILPSVNPSGEAREDGHGSQGVAVTWTALTGGESQWHIPHKPPNGEEPTMRKGSYSEELVKIDFHVENLSLPPRSPKEQ